MDPIVVAASLLSAVLHASWNAAVKADRDPPRAMTAQMIWSAAIVAPGLLVTGLPPLEALPWLAGSTAVNLLTVSALLRAYRTGGFGVVYPLMRAVAVLLVTPLSAYVAGDRLGYGAVAGVAIMTGALMLLARDASRSQSFSMAAFGWALLAGFGTALYILCDARGVRAAGSAWSYCFAVSITNAVAMGWRQRHLGSPAALMRSHWRVGVLAGGAAVVSYLLILWVWTFAPVAPTAALRDTSAIFALLIAVMWLKEAFTPLRIAAVLLAICAVPFLRLG